MELVTEIIKSFLAMAPYLVFGFLFAGVLHVFIKKEFILKHLGKNSLWSVIKASLFGVPLPLCSCSVIPTAISLKKSEASNSSVMSFLISTPLTGIDSIVATYGVLGPVFAIFRPIAAFFIGIAGGIAALIIDTEKLPSSKTPDAPSCCDGDSSKEESSCCSEGTEPIKESSCCSEEASASAESSCCSGGGSLKVDAADSQSIFSKVTKVIKDIWEYAFKTLLDDIALPLIVGIVLSGVIAWFIPDDFFGDLEVSSFVQMLIMIVVGVPLYICATASLPIGAVLLMKGMSPGVIFVFLAAGPVTNSATIALIIKQFGKKFFAVYFGVIAVFSIAAGLLLDAIIAFFNLKVEASALFHDEHGAGIITVIISIAFFVLLLSSLKRKLFPQKAKASSCCGS